MLHFERRFPWLYHKFNHDQSHSGQKQKGITSTQDTSLNNFTTFPETLQRWIEKNSSDVVIVCNTEGEIMFISRSVEQLLDYRKEELEGSKWHKNILIKDALRLIQQASNDVDILKPYNIQVFNRQGKY